MAGPNVSFRLVILCWMRSMTSASWFCDYCMQPVDSSVTLMPQLCAINSRFYRWEYMRSIMSGSTKRSECPGVPLSVCRVDNPPLCSAIVAPQSYFSAVPGTLMYVITPEVYSTKYRAVGLGSASVVTRLGGACCSAMEPSSRFAVACTRPQDSLSHLLVWHGGCAVGMF